MRASRSGCYPHPSLSQRARVGYQTTAPSIRQPLIVPEHCRCNGRAVSEILRRQPTRFPKSSQSARMQSHTAELEGRGALGAQGFEKIVQAFEER
ncbi:MAG: hypothetical protein QOF64_3183, partial [Candidatus Binatota bacterium]|nr:hypothetical protein [Candidatus Binatota bacterium]